MVRFGDMARRFTHGLTFSSISTLSVVLVEQLAAVPGLTLSLVDVILSVVLLKQLAAVPGLTFCMDPCTTDSLKRGIQHDEPVRVALMVGSERMMLSVVSITKQIASQSGTLRLA